MKRYSAYKDSGIEWIGEIPSDWGLKKLKYLFSLRSGEAATDERSGSYFLYGANGVISDYPKANISTQKIIIGRVGASGEINIAQANSWISDNALIVDLFDTSHFRYVYYLLKSINFPERINKTAQPLITGGYISNYFVPFPDFKQQKNIANFLDYKTVQIDDLIAKKERMIELLKEERAAVINQVVTKGLNPKAEMKDSGIDWMGKIPKHWGLKRLKYLVKLINEKGAINDNSIRVDLENIESWTGQLIKTDSITATDEEMKQFIPGDVLFNKLRPYLAKVFHARQEGMCGGELLVLRPSIQIDSKFLYHRVISNDFIRVIDGSTYGTKMPRASWDFIGNLCIPYPSFEEQRRIVDFIERKTSQIDMQVAREQESIELLKEYRTSLISEIVTGKMCVLNQDCGANNAA